MNKKHEWPALGRVDLNLFRVFDVIHRERNLTRAAAVLHLSQSAISHALARLREQLGDPLFIREGRGVAPTPVALRLAPVVSEALALLQGGVDRLQQFDPTRDSRTFILNMPEQLEPLLLPPIVAALRPHLPRVGVRSTSVRWGELKLEMAAGHIDLAVEVARPADAELRQCQLLREPLRVLAGPAFAGELDAERYLAARHIAVTSRRRSISVEDLALDSLGLSRHVVQRCQHYLTAAQLAAGSDGLLTVAAAYCPMLTRIAPLRELPMPLPLPPVTLNLYWHEQAAGEPGNRWLRERLLSQLGEGLAAPQVLAYQ
ncbi:LysR family transcriptional regulator [Metapseudomonas otitidis]|uniref:LysR family transcriptional regulator n=1 Tax=Metapseudomonas otitidis TaxID=319939 RepID=UPI000D1A3C49|nr:LysR family transcriptional regulator [Pseudomonas otitidis]